MSDFSWLGPPIDTRALFGPERARLLDLLRGLTPAEWRAEAVPGWSVHDLALHLLGDDYARLSHLRDSHPGGPRPRPGEAFEAFIHRANREWVEAARRLSPAMLVDTLELTGRRVADAWAAAGPGSPVLPVSWAGADPAPLWLDRARDFTEYWTHRQQIRLATGRAAEDGPEAGPHPLAEVLDTFMRALPHTLRTATAAAGTRVRVAVSGPAGGVWTATATAEGPWTLAADPADTAGAPAAEVEFDAPTAWRLCVRAIDSGTALARARTSGDPRLAEAVCRIVSIIR
ncbi:maleylpyruvate isomerase N-terminal domain-containing protein [Streptomonospora nanhaiensis]|uniref:maleylpyruvate isomerase N-terminal domain-containing protein n=1 Tax=Streptomonospora nanhaiensis TaxID=1323731 RepID=UPI001C38852D|nr:maleylpyruvate isomerase N-terminal domain-containing protein [Streptomonospora nanhaiensis]MBV2362195.1 maleylpyruvate isomerase family mycothiol-dependent enzyme [Streptomonospora nanhaiensis]